MARPKKPWSKVITEARVSVRIYERTPRGRIARCAHLDLWSTRCQRRTFSSIFFERAAGVSFRASR
jgi:hypothetical protein